MTAKRLSATEGNEYQRSAFRDRQGAPPTRQRKNFNPKKLLSG